VSWSWIVDKRRCETKKGERMVSNPKNNDRRSSQTSASGKQRLKKIPFSSPYKFCVRIHDVLPKDTGELLERLYCPYIPIQIDETANSDVFTAMGCHAKTDSEPTFSVQSRTCWTLRYVDHRFEYRFCGVAYIIVQHTSHISSLSSSLSLCCLFVGSIFNWLKRRLQT
jgi:hypothetical protein